MTGNPEKSLTIDTHHHDEVEPDRNEPGAETRDDVQI